MQLPSDKEAAGRAERGEDEEPAELAEAKIIVRSNGTVTYVGKDIAYHLWKFGLLGRDFHYRRFHKHPDGHEAWTTAQRRRTKPGAPEFGHAQEVFNVIDSRQAYPQQVVVAGLRALGYAERSRSSEAFCLQRGGAHAALRARNGLRDSARGCEAALHRSERAQGPGREGGRPARPAAKRARGKEVDVAASGAGRKPSARSDRACHRDRRAALFSAAIHALDGDRVRFQGRAELRGRDGTVRAIRGGARERNLAQGRGAASEDDAVERGESGAASRAGNSTWRNFLRRPAGDDLWELALLAGSLDARVEAAVGAQEPAFLARYAFELAQAFNVFYHKHHILSEEDAEKRAFLAAAHAAGARAARDGARAARDYRAGKDVKDVTLAPATLRRDVVSEESEGRRALAGFRCPLPLMAR